MPEARRPLDLPATYDPVACLPASTTERGIFHESRGGARLAAMLVANGTPQDLALAERVLAATLDCQELHPDDPHRGNFRWMREDAVVTDMNAVQFCLEQLVPMMLRHGTRLAPVLRRRVLDAITIGLEETARLDVWVMYSNIAVLDALTSSLGGELLDDRTVAARGYHVLLEWMSHTDRNGAPREFNSPTYTVVILEALGTLAELVRHEETRVRARLAAARLALSVALHIHAGTGRWSGPHSRVYQPTVVGDVPAEEALVRRWVADGTLPGWTLDVLEHRPDRMEVIETASVSDKVGLATYHSPSFALGVSSREGGIQADVLIVQYRRAGSEKPGVLYSRYLVNDKWFGDFYHPTNRTKASNLLEEGRFCGVQERNRAIGLYAPATYGAVTSAKACFIWTDRKLVEELWIGGRRVDALPVDVYAGEVVVAGSGGAWMALRPLSRTDFGRGAPARLLERGDDLVLEVHNHLGPELPLWQVGPTGAFFRGYPQCGVYLEVAERSDYADGGTLAKEVAAGSLVERVDPPCTFHGEGERRWSVEYQRDGRGLGIEIDLLQWRLQRRWTHEGGLGWPMLESPVARQSMSGSVSVGDASLACGGPAWLFASPATRRWVAGCHASAPAPLRLVTPEGSVEVDAMGQGTVAWDRGAVTVDALGVRGSPRVSGGRLVSG
jgi:hypothetical protein